LLCDGHAPYNARLLFLAALVGWVKYPARRAARPVKNKNGLRNGLYGPFFISEPAFGRAQQRWDAIERKWQK
jgi:hypothetical protein